MPQPTLLATAVAVLVVLSVTQCCDAKKYGSVTLQQFIATFPNGTYADPTSAPEHQPIDLGIGWTYTAYTFNNGQSTYDGGEMFTSVTERDGNAAGPMVTYTNPGIPLAITGSYSSLFTRWVDPQTLAFNDNLEFFFGDYDTMEGKQIISARFVDFTTSVASCTYDMGDAEFTCVSPTVPSTSVMGATDTTDFTLTATFTFLCERDLDCNEDDTTSHTCDTMTGKCQCATPYSTQAGHGYDCAVCFASDCEGPNSVCDDTASLSGGGATCMCEDYSTYYLINPSATSLGCTPKTSCGAGLYETTPGTTSTDRECTNCPIGFYCPASSNYAFQCPDGMFTSTTNQASCATAREGYFTPTQSANYLLVPVDGVDGAYNGETTSATTFMIRVGEMNVDECTDSESGMPSNICGNNATCTDTDGSYFCTCDDGYRSATMATDSTINCEDIDECDETENLCGDLAICFDLPGSYRCACKAGLARQGDATDSSIMCVDRNECTETQGLCGDNASCNNFFGGYNCTCNEGFYSATMMADSTITCQDIDECTDSESGMPSNICGNDAMCANTNGSYSCTCDDGYRSATMTTDSTISCEEINECTETPGICGNNTECMNNQGSYRCTCGQGYYNVMNIEESFGESLACIDINECAFAANTGLVVCPDNSDCTNTAGSYFCTCISGYIAANDETQLDLECVNPPPNITLLGADTVTLEIDEVATYIDSGASATDDGTPLPVVVSGVDAINNALANGQLGSFIVTFTATDFRNALSTITRTVDIVDTIHPSLWLIGPSIVLVRLRETTVPLSDVISPTVSVMADDTAISVTMSPTLTVLQSILNDATSTMQTTVTFTAIDARGLTTSVTQVVRFLDDMAPTIASQNDSAFIDVALNSDYSPLNTDVSVADNLSDMLTLMSNVVIIVDDDEMDMIDTTMPSVYSVSYSTQDASDNPSRVVSKQVTVIDTQRPMISFRSPSLAGSTPTVVVDAGMNATGTVSGSDAAIDLADIFNIDAVDNSMVTITTTPASPDDLDFAAENGGDRVTVVQITGVDGADNPAVPLYARVVVRDRLSAEDSVEIGSIESTPFGNVAGGSRRKRAVADIAGTTCALSVTGADVAMTTRELTTTPGSHICVRAVGEGHLARRQQEAFTITYPPQDAIGRIEVEATSAAPLTEEDVRADMMTLLANIEGQVCGILGVTVNQPLARTASVNVACVDDQSGEYVGEVSVPPSQTLLSFSVPGSSDDAASSSIIVGVVVLAVCLIIGVVIIVLAIRHRNNNNLGKVAEAHPPQSMEFDFYGGHRNSTAMAVNPVSDRMATTTFSSPDTTTNASQGQYETVPGDSTPRGFTFVQGRTSTHGVVKDGDGDGDTDYGNGVFNKNNGMPDDKLFVTYDEESNPYADIEDMADNENSTPPPNNTNTNVASTPQSPLPGQHTDIPQYGNLEAILKHNASSNQNDDDNDDNDDTSDDDESPVVHNCTRAEAENWLSGEAPGTYLVRAKDDEPNIFVISVTTNGTKFVHHKVVLQDSGFLLNGKDSGTTLTSKAEIVKLLQTTRVADLKHLLGTEYSINA